MISRRTLLYSASGPLWWRLAAAQAPDKSASALFAFHNRLWLNLHHFLYVLGRAKNNSPDSRRATVAGAIADRAGFEDLSAEDRARWENAVATYSQTVSRKDLLFDAPLALATRKIAALDDSARALPDDLDRDVRQALGDAAPVYRRVWWDRHSDSNRQRIGELGALVNRYGNALALEVSRLWMNEWPPAGFDVQVAAYASWAGAYSASTGLIVLASTDRAQAGTQGLESVFHEAMHQWDDDMDLRIGKIAQELKVRVPAQFSHSLIFYTAGYAVSKAIPGHQPYAIANGLWAGGALTPVEKLDRFWLPYLEGKTNIDAALRSLLL
jgi:hypothetical protein